MLAPMHATGTCDASGGPTSDWLAILMLTMDSCLAAKPVKASDGADQLQFNAPLWHNWWIGMMWYAALPCHDLCPAEQLTRHPGLHSKHTVRMQRHG